MTIQDVMNALAIADQVLSSYLELPHELLKDEVNTLDSKIQQLEKHRIHWIMKQQAKGFLSFNTSCCERKRLEYLNNENIKIKALASRYNIQKAL